MLGRLLGQILKARLPLIVNIVKPLAKTVLIPLRLPVAASGTNAAIHKTRFRSGFTTLIIPNEEMNYIMKISKSLEESVLLIKGVREKIKNEAKEQRRGFLSILSSNLSDTLLGKLLTGKGTITAGEGTIRAGENFQNHCIHENEPKFKDVYSRNNLSKIKNKTCIINLFEESIEIHWIALYANHNNVTYFDSLGVEHIPKEIKKFIGNKTIITNIYRAQEYDSIMCGYFCMEFIDFMLKGKNLLEYTNLFSPNDYEKMTK